MTVKKSSFFQSVNNNQFIVGITALSLFAVVGFGVWAAVAPRMKAQSSVLGATNSQTAENTKRVTACKELINMFCGTLENPTPTKEGCSQVKLVCSGVLKSVMMKNRVGTMNGQWSGDNREERRKVIMEKKEQIRDQRMEKSKRDESTVQ